MKTQPLPRGQEGFSLVEIVIAVGIVSIALLAIFGVFSTAVKTSGDTISQHEISGLTRSLSDALRTTNSAAGVLNYATLSNTFAASRVASNFCYISTGGVVTNTTDPAQADALATRPGRLFRMEIDLSSNAPGISNAADLASNAFIPLQVRVYSVPSAAAPFDTNKALPVYTYDTAVFR